MEQRLIDANAMKKYVDGCEFCNNCQRKKNRCAFECDLPDYLTSEWGRVIDEQPTVDAVPVVRCGECRRAIPFSVAGNRDAICHCDLFDATMTRKDFCSYGERKEKTDE